MFCLKRGEAFFFRRRALLDLELGAAYCNPEFSLSWRLAANCHSRLAYKTGLDDLSDRDRWGVIELLEEMTAQAFQYRLVVGVLTAHIAPFRFQLDFAWVYDNLSPTWTGVKRMLHLILRTMTKLIV